MINNVLHVGIFKDHVLGGDRIFESGFAKNGIIHTKFDYRIMADQIGIDAMNRKLVDEAKWKDLVFIGKGELIKPSTLAEIRKNGGIVAIWYGDLRREPDSWLVKNLKECDVFFMSSAGETLEKYYQKGSPRIAAYYFTPTNPDIIDEYRGIPKSIDPPLYTARAHHLIRNEREEVYRYLCKRGDVQIVGSPKIYIENPLLRRIYQKIFPSEFVRGPRYIELIIKSRFGIGVSAFQNVKFYTSDRLMHYLTFGKLFLAYRFPGCEELFKDGEQIVFYKNVKELGEKIDYFLENKDLAEEIGVKGQEKMIKKYNSENMVKMMLEIIENGHSDIFPWVEILS